MEYHNLADDRSNREALATFLRSLGYEIILRQANATPTGGNLWARRDD
jgi:hypothetical protein